MDFNIELMGLLIIYNFLFDIFIKLYFKYVFMIKDFNKWHCKKSEINNNDNKIFFHEREIWFCYLGVNIGFEQDGDKESFLRPVLILRKFNNNLFLCIPFTTKCKNGKFYYKIILKNKINYAIITQVRLIDSRRLKYFYSSMKKQDFFEIKKILTEIINEDSYL